MSRRTEPPIPRLAFTLVELLVVIGIIAVLIGILLPTVSKAQRQARSVACLSQLRQIGIGWNLYLHDSKGRFPRYSGNMQWFYGGVHPAIANAVFGGGARNDRLLNPYLGGHLTQDQQAQVFRCPDDGVIAPTGSIAGYSSPTRGHTAYEFYGNSYMMNHNLLWYYDPVRKVRDNKVPITLGMVSLSPSVVILAGDCNWYYVVNESKDDGDEIPEYEADFHKSAPYVNLVFLDGHAARTRMRPSIAQNQDYSFPITQLPPEEEESP